MRVIGIDENGLGPLLGPLLVTGVAFESATYDQETFWRATEPILWAGDSKAVFAPRKLAAAESATLRWLSAFGINPASHADLVDRVTLPCPYELQCKDRLHEICAPSTDRLPCWAKGFEPRTGTYRTHLADQGITAVAVRSIAICPGVFNAVTGAGELNKFRFDFELMIRLVTALAGGADQDTLALCGKIGSTRRYQEWFKKARIPLQSVIREEREQSAYRIDQVGTVSFSKDADLAHMPVAVASMVGKYLRELSMLRINRALDPTGGWVSGYRDRVTRAFVSSTKARRKEMGVEDFCFLRNS